MSEIRCPNCGTSFVIGNGSNPTTELRDGISYLVPETIRNENCSCSDRVNARLEVLKAAGVNVEKLKSLMNSNEDFKGIFAEDDPILNSISSGGFIRNPELFRRWITAQTFHLLKDSRGWTHAVRARYNTQYVFRQTRDELRLLLKLKRKGLSNDKRFSFFTLPDIQAIFKELADHSVYENKREELKELIINSRSLEDLNNAVSNRYWWFSRKQKFIPRTWLNCFKGAGAYYTLQNIIRTHDMVLPNCSDMNSSLEAVESVYNEIVAYPICTRRWDILLSVLTNAVKRTGFELKY